MRRYLSDKKLVYTIVAVIVVVVLVIIFVCLCVHNSNKNKQYQVVENDVSAPLQEQPQPAQDAVYRQIYSGQEQQQQQQQHMLPAPQDQQMMMMMAQQQQQQQPPGPPIRVEMSSKGPAENMVCTKIDRGHGNSDTEDNTYLCSSQDLGIKWSSTGPIDQMTCTRVEDQQDAFTWNDSYICVPNNSDVSLSMHYKKPVPGKSCVPWIESPAGYKDSVERYLCVDSANHTIDTY